MATSGEAKLALRGFFAGAFVFDKRLGDCVAKLRSRIKAETHQKLFKSVRTRRFRFCFQLWGALFFPILHPVAERLQSFGNLRLPRKSLSAKSGVFSRYR